jgi:aspartyl-tRNA(Asn)/glutamyl-tRNA(Gln) amidotransferase subunit B
LSKVKSGDISGKMAKTVFEEMFATGKAPDVVIAEKGLVQVSDESSLIPLVEKVIAAYPDNVAKYRSGKTKMFGFFVGQVMKETAGQANPQIVNRLLKERLDA